MYGLIKNVLSQDIIDEALSLYRNSINQVEIDGVVRERYISGAGAVGVFVLSRYSDEEFKNIWNSILPKLEEAIGKKVIPASFRILRYGAGGYIKPHKDSTNKEGFHPTKESLSVIIMLSNSGEGGELYMESTLIDIEPGDLVYCTSEHLHEVKPVHGGARHSINVRCFMAEG